MYELIRKKGKARRGRIVTEHGIIETPAFMPVATQATVKGVDPVLLAALNVQVFITNTYHLYLRPATDVLHKAGGIHSFMKWKKPVFTDSGGFQVLSLAKLRKFEKDGVRFQSHIDGSYHKFTPQNNVDMQRKIGSDVMMVLDECTEYPATHSYALKAMERTLLWAEQARDRFNETETLYGYRQHQFGIIQGSVYPNLRIRCAEELAGMDFEGYAMGGIAIGEPVSSMYEIIAMADDIMPEHKPRYLMGVGKEEDIRFAVNEGFDIFDCVIPTRNARNGTLFTKSGKISIRNAKFADDFSPVDSQCSCPLCTNFTRAYLHHLFKAKEISGAVLATIHNIKYYMDMMEGIREDIN